MSIFFESRFKVHVTTLPAIKQSLEKKGGARKLYKIKERADS